MAQSALFRRANLRLASFHGTRAVLLGFAASLLLAGGCDNSMHSADKTVSEKLREAQAKIDAAKMPPTASNVDLSTASADTTPSPAMQIHAKVLFADSELHLAQLLAAQVQANDLQIDQFSREIGFLASEIQANNLQVASLQEYDPTGKSKKVMDSITTAQEQVSTGTDGAWIKSDAVSIPSLSAAQAKRDSLQQDISSITNDIKTSTDQRTGLLDTADKLSRESDHPEPLPENASLKDRIAQRAKSADLFKQASDAREKAAELSVKIDQDSARLQLAKDNAAILQSQLESLNATVTALKAKGQSVNDSWAAVQAQISKLNADSKQLLGDDPAIAPKADPISGNYVTEQTIGSKARAIAILADASVKPRAEALDHFNKAIQLYGNAAGIARTLTNEIQTKMSQDVAGTKPEEVAWKAEKNALDPNVFLFQQGDAELLKANLLSRSASQATMRLNQIAMLKPIVEAAGLQSDLQPMSALNETDKTLVSQKNDGGSAAGSGTGAGTDAGARGSFNKAATLLETVYSSTAPQEIRNAAKVEQIYLQYQWAALETALGDAQMAAKHLSTAHEEAATAQTAGISIPPLPVEPSPAGSGAGMGTGMGTGMGAGALPTETVNFVPPTGDALKLVGTYKGQQTDPTFGSVSAVLTLKADGSLEFNTDVKTKLVPTGQVTAKMQGKWMMQSGSNLLLSFTSGTANGIPMPAGSVPNQTLVVSDDGKKLGSPDGKDALVKE